MENAVARFIIRGSYAALTTFEDGGTLIDAAIPGGEDLLMELIPSGDRSEITPESTSTEVWLHLPDFSYHLQADQAYLEIQADQAPDALFAQRPGLERVGATIRYGDDFVGADGASIENLGGRAYIHGIQRISVERNALWTGESTEAEVDADTVLASYQEQALIRIPVEEGKISAVLPEGTTLQAERSGCRYEGLTQIACGSLQLRLTDPWGEPLTGLLSDGTSTWRIPPGGGLIPVGPDARPMTVEAGPAYSKAQLDFPGGDAERSITLIPEIDRSHKALAVLSYTVAPDADTDTSPSSALDRLGGLGVEFAVLLSDIEVPGIPSSRRNRPWAQAGVRENGVWSWPWLANSKKSAHGAPNPAGLSALDLLSVVRGRSSDQRFSVVDATWAQAALAIPPSDWEPRPDALYLSSLEDLPVLIELLDAGQTLSPVGPYTWLGLEGDRNLPAFNRAIVEGWTTAGTGPALSLQVSPRPSAAGFELQVRVEAPAWMGIQSVSVWTTFGEQRVALTETQEAHITLPIESTWVLATVAGNPVEPWEAAAWAVSAPLWLKAP